MSTIVLFKKDSPSFSSIFLSKQQSCPLAFKQLKTKRKQYAYIVNLHHVYSVTSKQLFGALNVFCLKKKNLFKSLNEERKKKKTDGDLSLFLQNKTQQFFMDSFFSLNCPLKKSGVSIDPGASVTVPFWENEPRPISPACLGPLLSLLQLSCWWCTWATQALLENMGICRLYPLVIVLFCFNDLKAKLLVEVNCRLIADLHM